jgi:Ca-activated chloride channel family protein
MNGNDHDSQHELLCAYILGETSEEQTREIESALAASAELRAQRVELEQTIGLVRQELGDSMSLSDEAMSSLLAAAVPGQGGQMPLVVPLRPWHASPLLRAAAGIVLAIGGVLGVIAMRESRMPGARDLEVALSERSAPSSAHPADSGGEAMRSGDRSSRGLRSRRGANSSDEAAPGQEARNEDLTRARLNTTDLVRFYKVPGAAGAGGPGTPAPVEITAGLGTGRGDPQVGTGLVFHGQASDPAGSLSGEAAVKEEGVLADNLFSTGKPGFHDKTSADDQSQKAAEVVPMSDFYQRAQRGLPRTQDEGEPEVTLRPVSPARGSDGAFLPGGGGGSPAQVNAGRAQIELAEALGEAEVAREVSPPASAGGREWQDGLRAMGYDGDVDDWRRREARKLSAEELHDQADRHTKRIYLECRRRPGESPRDMFFRFWGDNPFVATGQDRLSTFAADVDTASYALARRYLEGGQLPTKAQIRTEEFVNYAKPDLPSPSEAVLAIHTELAPSLFGGKQGRMMLRVGIRGQEVSATERKPLSLTFAIDVSGSMKEGRRLELVKHAIRLLVGQLHEGDKVGFVAYSREARMVLPMTDASERGLIESALHPLSPNGGTNAEAGLKMAYELAFAALDPAAHSRVILLSDGVANIGTTDQDRINRDVTRYREAGIYLNTIGVGMNNHNDVFLEQLANKGDGICDYVDDEAAARRAIVERFTGALIPIAGDVKIQVEFDPTQVGYYRLLGYENRAIADADFRNDSVDAGEIGAGHQVVALYELDMVAGAGEGVLATVRLRWKAPKAARQHPLEVEVTEISATVDFEGAHQSFAEASAGYRRSVLTAQLAEFLRRSSHAREDSFRLLDDQTTRLAEEEGDEDSRELANLVKRSMALGLPLQLLDRTGVDLALDEYQRYLHMRARLDDLERLQQRLNDRELEDLERRNDELEERLREQIYTDLLKKNG